MRMLWVGGTGRSGTTLLRDVLALHPDVYVIPHESTPIPEHNERWAWWVRDVYREHMTEAKRLGATLFVEKSPRNCIVWDELRRRTADLDGVTSCRCVYIKRDTEQTVAALRRFGKYPHPPWTKIDDTVSDETIREWVERVDSVGTKGADVILTLFGLINNTAESLRMLGLEPVEAQLQYAFDRSKF